MQKSVRAPAYFNALGEVLIITGDRLSAAVSSIAWVISRLLVLNAPTA